MQQSLGPTIPPLSVPAKTPLRGRLGRWLTRGGPVGEHRENQTHPWYAVLWLTGMDYFSSLGFQPGIALLAAGALSPLATVFLVALTLGGALPIYLQVARRSFRGQGSIAMLEKLLPGWWGKLLVLVLLGFASTDFVITMTLCAADAAEHLIHNPFLEATLAGFQVPITLVLLALLAGVFLLGFSEAVGLAVVVGIPYILLNAVVIGRALVEIAQRPELLVGWQAGLEARGDWTMLLILAGLTFPKLALGLSGFETGVSVMPLVKNDSEDADQRVPQGRIRGSQLLLATAAVLMSVLLLTSSFVTTLLIPPAAYAEGGDASGRALAYLSHQLLGDGFGTVYDISTILILWFAGASAMAGLLSLLPRYLPRFGMAPAWVGYSRPLVLLLFAVNVLVTWIFQADVEAQGGAYATGVLALILSGAFAVATALWQEARLDQTQKTRLLSFYFWAVTGLFAYTLIINVFERPDGLIISGIFILAILIVSTVSRARRATELRVEEAVFADDVSAQLWPDLRGGMVYLVPLISIDPDSRARKARQIRQLYNCTNIPFAFLHVTLRDDRSDFLSGLRVRVQKLGEEYIIEIEGAVALANTIAYVSELLDPVAIYLGLTRKDMVSQSLRYLLFGDGETGILVYQILVEYWEWTREEDLRPNLFLLSD